MAQALTRLTVGVMTQELPPEVVVVGGGIAALEFVLALRDLAPDHVRATVVAPNIDFVARPMLVANPIIGAPAANRPLRDIAADAGFDVVEAAVDSVDSERRRIVLRGGGTYSYDTLVLAPGAIVLPAFEHAIHIGDRDSTADLARLGADVR